MKKKWQKKALRVRLKIAREATLTLAVNNEKV